MFKFPISFKQNSNEINRTFLFSLDSCNNDYLNQLYFPKVYSVLKEEGIIFPQCRASVAAETMLGHTTMLTGCHPNSSGIIGNGLYDVDLDIDLKVVQDPKYRLVGTIFEYLNESYPAFSTGFVSGKWRLPRFLSQGADFVFGAPITGIPLPEGYVEKLGYPVLNIEGDMYDQWTMRALTELVKNDDPDFIFINLAWLDVSGHDTGAYNLNIMRELRQLDNMLFQFLVDLKTLGKYDDSLFIFTGDHGMDNVNDFFNPEDYLLEHNINIDHIHWEGHCAFIYLDDIADLNETIDLMKENDKVAIALPFYELDKLNLDTYRNRTGDLFISCKENVVINLGSLPLMYFGLHGGVSTRDVPLAFMGPKIKKKEFIYSQIPSLADIVPTILSLWNMSIPNHIDGRVLSEIIQ